MSHRNQAGCGKGLEEDTGLWGAGGLWQALLSPTTRPRETQQEAAPSTGLGGMHLGNQGHMAPRELTTLPSPPRAGQIPAFSGAQQNRFLL